jgi:hypothetical protein
MATSTSKRTTAKGTRPGTPKSRVTSAKDWKSSARTAVELPLPSGNVCMAINKGMKVFLENGTVPNSLMEMVQSAIDSAEKKPSSQQIKDQAEDPNTLAAMITMMDKVVIDCVVEPVIMPIPTKEDGSWDEAAKDPDLLYVDDIELQDKMFIFQWTVGGTDDVAKFRAEFSTVMEDIPDGGEVEDSSK